VTGPFEQRLVADLRRAAESYEPDTERIRQLLIEGFLEEQDGGNEGNTASPRARGFSRRMTWLAAAASVVLAVSGSEILFNSGPTSGDTAGPATTDTLSGVSWAASGGTAANTTPPAGGDAMSVSPGSRASGGPTPSASANRTPSWGRTLGPDVTASVAPASGIVSPIRKVVDDREVTIKVVQAAAESRQDLSAVGDQWVAAPLSPGATSPQSKGPRGSVGPPQVMGNGASVQSSPFLVTWSDGVPAGLGQATTWLTVPYAVEGVRGGVRLPVRFGPEEITVTVLTGTVGGGSARLAVSGGLDSLVVELPGCGSTVCPFVVQVLLRPVPGSHVTAGDVLLDLTATDPSDAVGFAGASMR
jgi:hypothetical protein